jgi:hypothetical protein
VQTTRAVVAAAVLLALAGCAPEPASHPDTLPPAGPTYSDCVAQLVQAAADLPADINLDHEDSGIPGCTVAVGEHAGQVVTLGRSPNRIQFDGPDGITGQRIAGTYAECLDLLTWLTDSCWAIDGPWPFTELVLRDGVAEPVLSWGGRR